MKHDPRRDPRDRSIALGLLALGKATAEQLRDAVEQVQSRREAGEDAALLDALVALELVSAEEAQVACAAWEAQGRPLAATGGTAKSSWCSPRASS